MNEIATTKKAIDLVTKAVEEDKKHNYEEALRLYEHSIEYFEHVIEYEARSDRTIDCINAKYVLYVERAEKIRKYLLTKAENSSAPSMIGRTMTITRLEKGIDALSKATEEDKRKNYEGALRLYELGIKYFLHAIEYEAQTDEAKDSIIAKFTQYVDRAEKIKEYLTKTKNKETLIIEAETKNGCKNNGGDDPEKKELQSCFDGVIEKLKNFLFACPDPRRKGYKHV